MSSEKLQEVHAYRIRVINTSGVPVRLLRRHWYFEASGGGPIVEASGEGVVGQKPILRPGQCFEYYSGTSLTTRWGHMYGELEFTRRVTGGEVGDSGEVAGVTASNTFKARIDRTLLAGATTTT